MLYSAFQSHFVYPSKKGDKATKIVSKCDFTFWFLPFTIGGVKVSELIGLDPDAWTEILQSKPESKPVVVEGVAAYRVNQTYTRYVLTLEKHSDPVVFIGKRVKSAEGRFYQDVSAFLSFLTPRCHYSFVDDHSGWVILDEAPNHRLPEDWGERELERIVGNLANLHLAFWGQRDKLAGFDWLPAYLSPMDADSIWQIGALYEIQGRQKRVGLGLSAQAANSLGALLPAFERASIALQLMQEAGGWRGVTKRAHLNALADLLDDPMPMLYPLRRLPPTLLHQNLAPNHWRLTLFGDCVLLDWKMPAIGPAVCDLINFTEQFALIQKNGKVRERADLPMSIETIIDTYFLRLYSGLYPLFNGRELRQAIPAARCLQMITHWLPRFVSVHNHRLLFHRWESVAPYFVGLFNRFLHAYKSL